MANIIFSEAAGLNESIYGKSQAPIRAFLEKRAEVFEQASLGDKIFKKSKSTHYGEKYTSMTAMLGPQPVGENGPYPTDGYQEGYSKTLEHVVWKDSFAVTREMADDANLIDLKKKPNAFVTAHYRTLEEFAAAMIGKAMSGASTVTFRDSVFDLTCADGYSLFNTAHPSKVKTAVTQCNQFADTVSAANLGKLETKMHLFTDDDGNLVATGPDTIIIPEDPTIKKAVFEAIGSEKNPETANNAFNYQYGRWNVIIWPYLNAWVDAGDSPWILFDSNYNSTYDCAVWLDRVALEVRSYLDESTDANVWKGYSRFSAGFIDWRAFAIGGIVGASSL